MPKKTIIAGIAVLFLFSTLHLGLHHHDHKGKNEKDFDNDEHLSFLQQCEKCLIKDNRSSEDHSFTFSSDFRSSPYISLFLNFEDYSLTLTPISRPPPKFFTFKPI